jgi:hypothetical protein
MRNLYKEVIDHIVAELEAGAPPWLALWSRTFGLNIPRKAATGREYSGTNKLLLWMARSKGWPAPHFLTLKQAMPRQGASSGFKYGRAVGAIEVVITCCAIPLTIAEPSMCKKFHALRGGDKEAGRQRALQLFPNAHGLLARKKDHGRAEAALIALYSQHQFIRIPAQAGIGARTYSGTSSPTA